jgi:hypothetical protein
MEPIAMPWVRIDDQLSDHPKIVAAGPDAAWLYIAGLCYASRYLTDGFIPEAQVRRLTDIKSPIAAAKRLVDVGLWDEVEGGYMVHDYLEYNYDANTVKERRRRNAERQSRWRNKKEESDVSTDDVSNEDSNALRNGVTDDVSNAASNGPVTMPHTHTHTPIEISNEISCDGDEEKPRKPRARDLHFETICKVFDYDWDLLNDSERGKVNRAVKLIKQAKGSPEDIERAYQVYPDVMPSRSTCTPMAIANNWNDLMRAARSHQTERDKLLAMYPPLT